jgi:Domain of unknown function (DUF4190)
VTAPGGTSGEEAREDAADAPQQFGAPPAGYEPPHAPFDAPFSSGGRYPAPGYSDGAGPEQELLQPGTNRVAIASLVAAFAGLLCLIGSIVAIVLGTIALDQIKRDRQAGFGMAVAGIVIGVAGLLIYTILALFALQS